MCIGGSLFCEVREFLCLPLPPPPPPPPRPSFYPPVSVCCAGAKTMSPSNRASCAAALQPGAFLSSATRKPPRGNTDPARGCGQRQQGGSSRGAGPRAERSIAGGRHKPARERCLILCRGRQDRSCSCLDFSILGYAYVFVSHDGCFSRAEYPAGYRISDAACHAAYTRVFVSAR